jgi:hypothetical protein
MQYAQELEFNSAHLVEHIESQLVAILIQRQTHADFDEQQANRFEKIEADQPKG